MRPSMSTPARPPPSNLPIAIIGAGVAGLTLAQACRRLSIPFRLFERHPRSHSRQGHRFRISDEAYAALTGSLQPDLRDLMVRTAPRRSKIAPRYPDAKEMHFERPRMAESTAIPIDRSWIRALLGLGIEESIEYGREFASYEVKQDHVTVNFADGNSFEASLLVGADGMRSRVRRQLQPDRRLLDLERWILWGRTPLTDELRARLTEDMMSWYMAIDREAGVQVVVEPMIWERSTQSESSGRLPDFKDYFYWAMAIAPTPNMPKTAEERRTFVMDITKDWHPTLRRMLDAADFELSSCLPVLSSKPDIELPSKTPISRVTIIGDAAHSLSPMGQAGADLAFRDATDLAEAVAAHGPTEDTVRRFEKRMAERAQVKLYHAFAAGRKYWPGGEYKEVDIWSL